jgi:hypothetical protein
MAASLFEREEAAEPDVLGYDQFVKDLSLVHLDHTLDELSLRQQLYSMR